MFHFGEPWWEIVVRTLIIYVVFLVALRFFGKREVGQFTLTDLVLILLVANAVQPAMTGPDLSVGGGLLIIASLFLANFALAYLRMHNPFVRSLLEGEPAIIARDGHWITDVLRKQGVDMEEAEMALREHGVGKIDDVELAVLEADGTISVVPAEGSTLKRGRRHVRYRKLQQ